MSELPKGWVETSLGELSDWGSGGTPSRSNPAYFGGAIPWVTISDLKDGVVLSTFASITEAALENSAAKLAPVGSILVALYGSIGKLGIAGIPVTTNQAIAYSLPNKWAFDSKYLYHYLRAERRNLLALGSGVTQKNIYLGDLKAYRFPLAPRHEQTRIVAKLEELLSDLDAGVAELKAAQKKLAQYRQSLLKAAVEGALTAAWRTQHQPTETGAQLLQRILQERRARWEARQLAKFAEQGKTPPKDWQKKYPEPVQPDTSGLPELPQGWVWATAEMLFSWGSGDFLPASAQIDGDYPVYGGNGINGRHNAANVGHATIVIGRVGAHCGNVFRTESAAWVTDNAIYATAKNEFITWAHSELTMQAANLGSGSKGGAQPFISQKILNDTFIALPPIREQERILEEYVVALNSNEEMAASIAISLQQSTAQRQNILRAAFSGQLVPQDPHDEPASALLERIRAERAAQGAVKKPRGRKAKEAA
ncbi:restriction endonuclease subunit S [Acidovorax sp. JHL-3]|uniref:restriction endonuclease subunit S n=1 Tax=Acidovorax sp. JHL-3 TaxID=1276755 RepID=UPI000554FFD5|nr:restriction endonuclease subunit S [Acidovorax sp. JHL-3]